MGKKSGALATRVYAALLAACPSEFRREYGREMALVFADRCRESVGRAATLRVWREALADLARTAAREQLESLRQGGRMMKTVRTILIALLAYAFTLLVVAPLYVRNVSSLPAFADSLIDALISTGLLFNFVFLLLTLTRLSEGARAVRATLVIASLVVAALIAFAGVLAGPGAGVDGRIISAQVLSVLVWFSIHLWWVRRGKTAGPAATA